MGYLHCQPAPKIHLDHSLSETAAAAAAATGISAERQRELLLQSAAVKFICRTDFVARVQQSEQPQVIHKVVLYRDTGLVDPGSGPILGSVSGSEIHILGTAYAKDTVSLY